MEVIWRREERLNELHRAAGLAMSIKKMAREHEDQPLEAKAGEDLAAILEQIKALTVSPRLELRARQYLARTARKLFGGKE